MTGTSAVNETIRIRSKQGFGIYERNALRINRKYRGPAIVTEYSATTLIPAKKQFWVDRAGNLIIRVRDQQPST